MQQGIASGKPYVRSVVARRIKGGVNRMLEKQSDRRPAGKRIPIRGTGVPLGAGPGNAPHFPAPAGQCHPDPGHPHHKRQAPAGGGAGAGQGSAWRCGRGDGPCHRSGVGGWDSDLPPPVRAGSGNAARFPRPCGTGPRRPAGPGMTAGQRPPGAGRALAGGFGPPAGLGSAWRCGRGDGPCHGSRAGGSDDVLPPPVRAGPGNAPRFPRPRGTLPPRPMPPAPRGASARPGGREAPTGGGAGAGRGLWAPGWSRISEALWQGQWPLPGGAGLVVRSLIFRPQSGRDQETHCVSPPVRDSAP
jgi:hypothetical protein